MEGRGFGKLPCIMCGEPEASITVDLDDLTLHCGDCDNDFDARMVANVIAKWKPVLEWLDAAGMRM